MNFKPSKAAKTKGVCCTLEEADKMYTEIDEKLKNAAISMLRRELIKGDNPLARVKQLVNLYGRQGWLWHFHDEEIAKLKDNDKKWIPVIFSAHHGWGMAVRNLLRTEGFGEKELKVHNLDCFYVALVADAAALEGGLL